MRPLVLLWSCLMLPGYEALKCPKEISGFEGDTVSLKCTYGEEQRKLKKYWCKETGIFISRCSSTIYSGKDGQEITKDRVSIRDSPQELAFTVTLRDLTLQDAGKYWCGAYRLGVDETSPVSLIVFPGPCCPPSPTLSLQPLATTRLQPKAKARQTQPPVLTSPGLRLTVTTAKQGKTEAEASPVTGTVPFQHTGTSPHTRTSPYAGTSLHTATSPHAGSSRPPMPLDSTLAEDTSSVPSSHSSKSRVSIPMVRILAPVFVLLSLLLVTGLIAFGSFILQWRKKGEQGQKVPAPKYGGQYFLWEQLQAIPGYSWLQDMPFTSLSAQLTLETQKNEKVHLPTLSSMPDSEAELAFYLGRGICVSPKISPSRRELDRVPIITPDFPPDHSCCQEQAVLTKSLSQPLEKSWVPEEAVINLSGPPEPLTSPESSAGPYKETQCLSQTTEEPEAPSQDPAESTIPVPALLMSEEELGFSKFVSV
ncbi:CMRF35-like molecule 9 [Sciurus carolinensis]|uniref:CMRF35-like molecule 9 n=1 Tax=Sciurus carolinensis TaxID=30640 RepID=A0AA41NBH3_SCICA|nr:CMRF35-like molecule 9 [Sciurus carolinensis]